MSQEMELSTEEISAENAPAIYGQGGLSRFIEAVRAKVEGEVPDLTTRKGRERIASLAAQVSRSKTAVEKPGRDYLKTIKELPKKIETELREFVLEMDTLRDQVRRPLTEWEEAEESRVAEHQAGLEHLRNTNTEGASSAMIKSLIADMEIEEIGADWEEFEAEAHRVKADSLAMLRSALTARSQYEAEQAELARLRAELEERERLEREAEIARAAAEQAIRAERDAAARREIEIQLQAEQAQRAAEAERQRIEREAQAERDAAEQRAKAERDAAERRESEAKAAAWRRELELKLQAEQAEREKLEAQHRAEQAKRDSARRAEEAAAAERQRQADEQARIKAEAEAREADRSHKSAVLKAAKEAVMTAGLSEEQAKAAVKLIAAGGVPRVFIAY